MAKDKLTRREQKQFDKLLKNKDVQKIMANINMSDKEIVSQLYGGLSKKEVLKDRNNLNKIQRVINDTQEKYKQYTGDNVSEFLIAAQNNEEKSGKSGKGNSGNNQNIVANDIKKMMEGSESLSFASALFAKNKNRFQGYKDYDAIVTHITQVDQAMDVYTDNILSPDDFSKDTFNFFYNCKDDLKKEVTKNVKKLEEVYKHEALSKKWIREILIKGDKFVAYLPLENEFNNLIGEDGQLLVESGTVNTFNSNTILLEDSEIKQFGINEEKVDSFKSELTELINERVVTSENPFNLITEDLQMLNEFKNLPFGDNLVDLKAKKDNNGKSNVNLSSDNNVMSGSKNNSYVTGTYVKELEAERVVKIMVGQKCFGYYYIETFDDAYNPVAGGLNNLTSVVDMQQDGATLDQQYDLFTRVFLKNLSKKIDKKYIQHHPEFKHIIYDIVSTQELFNKKVKLTYLPPDQVVHYHIELGSDGYGISKLKKILFTSKLYIAVLICTLMMQLSRSVDKRAFYIETGLDEDLEGTIQAFIRDVKSNEINMDSLDNFGSIFDSIGQFKDYYIPQVNGEKAVDIDSISGQALEMENELLEYLRKTMISGLGMPSSYLSYSDEMDFARSVSMVHGMFLNNVVSCQKPLGGQYTGAYQKLYRNEFSVIEGKSDDESKKYDPYNLSVTMPPPAFLNMTNMSEMLDTAITVTENKVRVLLGDDGQDKDPVLKDMLFKEIIKSICPIDWERYEDILEKARRKNTENQLKNTGGEGGDDSSSGGDNYGF